MCVRKGVVKSQLAHVTNAYLKKEFEVPPYSEHNLEGSQVEIRCYHSKGNPVANIHWLKDDIVINEEEDKNFIVTSEGHLIIIELYSNFRRSFNHY